MGRMVAFAMVIGTLSASYIGATIFVEYMRGFGI